VGELCGKAEAIQAIAATDFENMCRRITEPDRRHPARQGVDLEHLRSSGSGSGAERGAEFRCPVPPMSPDLLAIHNNPSICLFRGSPDIAEGLLSCTPGANERNVGLPQVMTRARTMIRRSF
jgi:hypothetical protein